MVLLGASAYGLHAFQYDGWRFQQMMLPTDVVGAGVRITSLRTTAFDSVGFVGE